MVASKINTGELIYVKSMDSIGFVVDRGEDPNGNCWCRTDVDGVRDEADLEVIRTEARLQELKGPETFITPLTEKKVEKYFAY